MLFYSGIFRAIGTLIFQRSHTLVSFGLLLLMAFCQPSYAQLNFGNISFDNGLSNSTVLSICRSSDGFLWIGTRDGLNRYDGHTIKQYRARQDDIHSLSTNNYIYTIVENPYDHTLWIGTQDGLNIYDPRTDSFTRIPPGPSKTIKQGRLALLSILFDGTKVYLGTNDGLAKIDHYSRPEIQVVAGLQGKELHSLLKKENDLLIGTNKGLFSYVNQKNIHTIALGGGFQQFIRHIKQVDSNKIWIATDHNGLYEIDDDYQEVQHYTKENGLSSNFVRSINKDLDGNVWIGTMEGLTIYFKHVRTFSKFSLDRSNPFSLTDNSIKTIVVDAQNIVWIGTNFGGINYYNTSVYNFKVFHADGHKEHISGDLISAIKVDTDGHTWVGTERDGLNLKRKGSDKFEKIALRSNTIKCILLDDKYAYIGTFDAGMARINRRNLADISYYNTSGNNSIRLSQNYISSIAKDLNGNIWIGTGNSGLQCIRADFSTVLAMQEHTETAISNNYIKDILPTQDGAIWVATAHGANRRKKDESTFTYFTPQNSSLAAPYINTLFEDRNKQIWIGTQEKGLYKFHEGTSVFEQIPLFGSDTTYHVLSIANGTQDELILSTSKGLVFYNTKTHDVAYKTKEDGLPTNQLLPNALSCDEDRLLVGSYKGLIEMNISHQLRNTTVPRVLFTEFLINSQRSSQIIYVINLNWTLKSTSLRRVCCYKFINFC